MCREIVENVLSGTKAGIKATRNLVFNQKAERSTMNRQKSRAIVENVLSGTKAGFKAILNFEHAIERKKMDHQKSKSTFSAILPALILMVAAFWVSSAVGAEKKMVKDPTTGKMVTAPEYGGTLTTVKNDMAASADATIHGGNVVTYLITPVLEKLVVGNWAIDRKEHGWNTTFAPLSAQKGALAESWEQPDPLTYVFKIRQGVHWQNKAPMNGRALTADDIEYHFHRMYGLGSGFTEPSTQNYWDTSIVESVTATDKYTVVFKLKEPSLSALVNIVDAYAATWIYPPEVIKEHGDAKDWRNLVGTGPFMLTNLVEGVSMTYTKNPDYWAYDEKYPENRLPYIDELTALVMPEEATRLAGLRTGVIDYMGPNGNTALRSIDQVESLQRTNPELVIWPYKWRSDNSFGVNVSKPPFNDIRVRKAMQMALDLETIYATYYKGYGSARPQGQIADDVKGWSTPFEEWPEEVKKVYTYDAAGAEALLDEAGYKRGADGIRFKTVLKHLSRYDATFSELAAAYWGEIGVDVEVQVVATNEWGPIIRDRLFEMASAETANRPPNAAASAPFHYQSTQPNSNRSNVNDPDYDAIYEAQLAATTIEEAQRLTKEAYMYALERHWTIWGGSAPLFAVSQPWVMGYNGEFWLGLGQQDTFFARLWIDSELKKEMGN